MSSLSQPTFDQYAHNYDDVLNAAIAASGETKEYFARGRMVWLADRLRRHAASARSVLDFGCGTGTSTRLFFEILAAESVLGLDVSPASIAVAARDHRSAGTNFTLVERHVPEGRFELAFSNGVFHHIPVEDRLQAVDHVIRSLCPGGLFAFWENNAWNPGSRYCMWVNPFDRDAVPISPLAGARLLRRAGLEILETTFLFFFPRSLGLLRPLEPRLCRLPLGAQYLILARKPSRAPSANEAGR
ncbi:MAG TPA: class I SAM-dependent methyltransferase [Pirellulales bacterium]|nr:class I SAM-dependent methyltransferase [Pirellulales bacterium]